MNALSFVIYFAILALFVGVSLLLFYHIGRYSYLGDASKRAFFFYSVFGFIIAIISFILLIINQLII